MTIREFLNNGAEIQGKVIVKKWSEATEEYLYTIEIQDEYSSNVFNLDDDDMEMEIKYIYVVDNCLILEIVEEDGY